MTLNDTFKKLNEFKIGNTSLMKIDTDQKNVFIFAKCEWENEFGSIKDRVAIAMIKNAINQFPQLLDNKSGYRIIEYSGGNLALAIAEICNKLKVSAEIVLPDSMPKEFLEYLSVLGVKIFLVDSKKGFFGVIQAAKKYAKQDVKRVFLYQHTNLVNLETHKNITANEIYNDFIQKEKGIISAYVASIGTGASLIGVYLGLKDKLPNLKLYATSPKEMPYATSMKPNSKKKFSGSGGLGYRVRQPFVKRHDTEIFQHFYYTLEECLQEMKQFYIKHKILIGSSSAANYLAAKRIAKNLRPGENVVTVFPSLSSPSEKKDTGLL